MTALGAPPAFDFISVLLETFNGFLEHANIRTPRTLDRLLGLTLATPEMHRIDHSKSGGDSQTNFGGLFPWWDSTLRDVSRSAVVGYDAIAFGVDGSEGRRHQTLHRMIAHPFLSEATDAGRTAEPSAIAPPGSGATRTRTSASPEPS